MTQRSNKALVKRMTGGTGILPDGYGDAVEQNTATGFDFEPLPHGDVLMQFLDDDGEAINTQVITKECLARIPVIVHAFFLAVEEGKEAAIKYLNGMSGLELDQFHSSQRNQP